MTAPLYLARECFLDLLGQATRFEEDVDGESFADGHRTMTCRYHLTVNHAQLTALCEALEIEVRFSELPKAAIDRALAEPPVQAGTISIGMKVGGGI